jgi:protein-disulfide isomerase
MTPDKKDITGSIITGLMVCCALVTTGLLVRDNFSNARNGQVQLPPDREVENWDGLLAASRSDGDTIAPVTMLIFTDLECPACRRFHTVTLPRIRDKYSRSDLRVAFRHWPLGYHRLAMPAAIAAECAANQGRFLEFLDAVFNAQDSLSILTFTDFARRAGVDDTTAHADCMSLDTVRARVERDKEVAESLGGGGTPMILLDGTLLGTVPSMNRLTELIEEVTSERRQD